MRAAHSLTRSHRAALGAGAVLVAVYAATLAPGVTLWDAGELIAAIHGVGVPHPPGTPLFVLVGRAWVVALGWLPTALAANLMSAVATAGACALGAALVARWSGSAWAGAAAGACAGLMSSVWRNATETEVYALALLLAVVILVAAERAGREGGTRRLALVAYLVGLAVPLHILALVVAPAAVLLACTGTDGRFRWGDAAVLAGAVLLVTGAGTVDATAALAGALVMITVAAARPALRGRALAVTGAVALALTPVLVMMVRARLDPALDQGHPATWSALVDVIARRQYAVAGLWPRQAPLWLQLGNLLEYADWQVALGLNPEPPPSAARTGLTLVFASLGLYGAVAHARRDRRSWRAIALLALTASVGVVLHLNLKAGPSFGFGILPDGAPREARERDYFFVLAFWCWGLWAGMGAVEGARRLARRAAPAGFAVAMLPAALNWSAVDRSRGPDAHLARDLARALLLPLPPRAVLLTAGDNDSYPLWYLQQVEGARRDVAVVVVPLLPTAWYRAELARREGLGTAATTAAAQGGVEGTVRRIAADAASAGRPLAASALLDADTRRAAGGRWVLAGAAWRRADDAATASSFAERGGVMVDSAAAAATLPLVARQLGDGPEPPPSHDPAARGMRRILQCVALASGGATGDPTQLATRCNAP